ncbi:MAG: hypothetical protein IJI68_01780 [Eggerthellaceae bacterium]|nr:hypothetical protein [Eggerthellaceae bacterium]
MKKDLTELVFIVDRSGSMGGLETDTIGGFNATLGKHRQAPGEAVVSTVLFDNEMKVLHDRIPIAEVKDMTDRDYQVRGCTALLDAVGEAIHHIGRVHGYLPDEYRPEHTIFVITTDGYENASVKYDYRTIKAMIEQKKEEGWEFLFLGANIDAVGEAAKIGISADRSVTYMADGLGTRLQNEAVAKATYAMRCKAPGAKPIDGSWKRDVEADTAKRGGHRRGFFSR